MVGHFLFCAFVFLIMYSDKTIGYVKSQYGWRSGYAHTTNPSYNHQNNHYHNSISGAHTIHQQNSKSYESASNYPNIGWNHPSNQISTSNHYDSHEIGNNPISYPSKHTNNNPYHHQSTYPTYNFPVHSSNSVGVSQYNLPTYYPPQNRYNSLHPSNTQNIPYISHANGVIMNTYPPKYIKTYKTIHHYHHNDPYRQNYHYRPDTRNRQVLPQEKVLVSDQSLPASTTHCRMTLCSEVANYPFYEIENLIHRTRQMFNSGIFDASLRLKGISLQNFTSKNDSFWYGKEAPDHHFVDSASSCREHVYTYYPREGYSTDNNTYYIVNVSSLRQGLTNIECESTNQMCRKQDVPASETRSCHQMFREEQLLVLPSNKRVFNVEHFELKTFHVPTGCACIAST